MKRKKRDMEFFNLSFLDVISCGFGAVVMLVLIFKPSGEVLISGMERTVEELSDVLALTKQIAALTEEVERQQARNALLSDQDARLRGEEKSASREMEQKNLQDESLKDDMEGLALVQSTLKRAAISANSTKTQRDEEVGGIPVDSDHVVFVVDTSGSMRQIWPRVAQELTNVLNIHPKVQGFQVLDDLGRSIVSAYEGRWIPDTPGRRKSVINLFHAWTGASNSSPVEGIEAALSRYAKSSIRTAIYVFGDDYTGPSYDLVVDRLTKKNTAFGGARRARIHAVGFLVPNTTNRFAVLMRELTRRNNGTFLALPP